MLLQELHAVGLILSQIPLKGRRDLNGLPGYWLCGCAGGGGHIAMQGLVRGECADSWQHIGTSILPSEL